MPESMARGADHASAADHAGEVPYGLTRAGVLMSPEPGNSYEVEGTLNPGSMRGPDGDLYLYPRLVAEGNVSRIGRARILVRDGVPVGVERRGIVLAPDRAWERGPAHGGVEDPRITALAGLDVHVMAYVAYGPLGPRPGLALSEDGITWRRIGPLQFGYQDELGTDLTLFPNKDVVWFPEVVADPGGRPSYAVLHRPTWELGRAGGETPELPAGVTDARGGIWISYVPAEEARRDPTALARPRLHAPVAMPAYAWEALKIGSGPPPVRVDEGWLLVHHGVSGSMDGNAFVPQKNVRYCAGAMILDAENPARVLARTAEPILAPETPEEIDGTVGNVVFPTAVERIGDERFVFYGMADSAIGVARLDRR